MSPFSIFILKSPFPCEPSHNSFSEAGKIAETTLKRLCWVPLWFLTVVNNNPLSFIVAIFNPLLVPIKTLSLNPFVIVSMLLSDIDEVELGSFL